MKGFAGEIGHIPDSIQQAFVAIVVKQVVWKPLLLQRE